MKRRRVSVWAFLCFVLLDDYCGRKTRETFNWQCFAQNTSNICDKTGSILLFKGYIQNGHGKCDQDQNQTQPRCLLLHGHYPICLITKIRSFFLMVMTRNTIHKNYWQKLREEYFLNYLIPLSNKHRFCVLAARPRHVWSPSVGGVQLGWVAHQSGLVQGGRGFRLGWVSPWVGEGVQPGLQVVWPGFGGWRPSTMMKTTTRLWHHKNRPPMLGVAQILKFCQSCKQNKQCIQFGFPVCLIFGQTCNFEHFLCTTFGETEKQVLFSFVRFEATMKKHHLDFSKKHKLCSTSCSKTIQNQKSHFE